MKVAKILQHESFNRRKMLSTTARNMQQTTIQIFTKTRTWKSIIDFIESKGNDAKEKSILSLKVINIC